MKKKIKLNNTLSLVTKEFDINENNTIQLFIKDKCYIKITEQGFFWKGKLIAEDNDIYLQFKEFLKEANEIKSNG